MKLTVYPIFSKSFFYVYTDFLIFYFAKSKQLEHMYSFSLNNDDDCLN